jgi:hypothetical protein
MTLDQWTSCCAKAIKANFRSRNTNVLSDVSRHQQIVRARRNTIRRWIAELRYATNPETAQIAARNVVWSIN